MSKSKISRLFEDLHRLHALLEDCTALALVKDWTEVQNAAKACDAAFEELPDALSRRIRVCGLVAREVATLGRILASHIHADASAGTACGQILRRMVDEAKKCVSEQVALGAHREGDGDMYERVFDVFSFWGEMSAYSFMANQEAQDSVNKALEAAKRCIDNEMLELNYAVDIPSMKDTTRRLEKKQEARTGSEYNPWESKKESIKAAKDLVEVIGRCAVDAGFLAEQGSDIMESSSRLASLLSQCPFHKRMNEHLVRCSTWAFQIGFSGFLLARKGGGSFDQASKGKRLDLCRDDVIDCVKFFGLESDWHDGSDVYYNLKDMDQKPTNEEVQKVLGIAAPLYARMTSEYREVQWRIGNMIDFSFGDPRLRKRERDSETIDPDVLLCIRLEGIDRLEERKALIRREIWDPQDSWPYASVVQMTNWFGSFTLDAETYKGFEIGERVTYDVFQWPEERWTEDEAHIVFFAIDNDGDDEVGMVAENGLIPDRKLSELRKIDFQE